MAKRPKRKKSFRLCPVGKHWRRPSKVHSYNREGKLVRAHTRKGTCVRSRSGKDIIYRDELNLIKEHFKSSADVTWLKSQPGFEYKAGNNYDKLIWLDKIKVYLIS